MDFSEAAAILVDRRSMGDVTIMLPDFCCSDVQRLLSFLYSGKCYVVSKAEIETFKSVFQCLRVDSFMVRNLKVTREHSPCKPNLKRKGSEETETKAKKSRLCEVCDTSLLLNHSSSKANLDKYTGHITVHLKDELFDDLPILNNYYCAINSCPFQSPNRYKFIRHLTKTHSELHSRIERRIREQPSSKDQLKSITKTLQELGAEPSNSPITSEQDILESYEGSTEDACLKCLACDESFKTKENATMHFFRHHYVKDEFKKSLAAIKTLPKRAVQARTTIKCQEGNCSFVTLSKCMLLRHLADLHGLFDDVAIGDVIPDIGDLDSVFTGHETDTKPAESVPVRLYQCENCCQSFKVTEAKKHFESAIHRKDNRVVCNSCDFSQKCSSLGEFRAVHNQHQCEEKPAKSSAVSNLYSSLARNMSILKQSSKDAIAGGDYD